MRVLVTAFEPYDRWYENASSLVLAELTKTLAVEPVVTARWYPVDFDELRKHLEHDISGDLDYAIHLGQAPGASCVQLESIGVNVRGQLDQKPDEFQPLAADGPVAYRTALPLARWAGKLRDAGIPAQVSYHAGTFLCNATHYLSHHVAEQRALRTKVVLIHVPLDPRQVGAGLATPSLPIELSTNAVRLILDDLASNRILTA